MPENTVRVRRKYWIVLSGAVALLVMAWLGLALVRERSVPPPPPPPTKSEPSPDAKQGPDPTFLVLVWMESTPPGARIVRSDGHTLGYTPDIVEFHQSNEPQLVRFEMEGYLPVTREVSAASDGELAIVLQAIPKKHAPATNNSKRSKAHRKSD